MEFRPSRLQYPARAEIECVVDSALAAECLRALGNAVGDRPWRVHEAYRTIPTLVEYIVISHRERRITVHRRNGDRWVMRSAIRGGTVRAEAIGAVLEVDAIYRNSSVA